MVSRSDFLRIGAASRDGKSPTGVPGKANRRGLLCSVMAKVQLIFPLLCNGVGEHTFPLLN